MKTKLKMKIKSLAAEAKIIRAEELKNKAPKLVISSYMLSPDNSVMRVFEQTSLEKRAKWFARAESARARSRSIFESLHNHRTNEVRNEARASLLAYGYIRGLPYTAVEGSAYVGNTKRIPHSAIITRAANIANRFSEDGTVSVDEVLSWVSTT